MKEALGIVVLTAVGLGGCAQSVWVKPGGTPQSFEADKFDCEQRVVTMYGGYANMGLGHAIVARDDIKRCMLTRGWQEQVQQPQATPVQHREADYIPPSQQAHEEYPEARRFYDAAKGGKLDEIRDSGRNRAHAAP